MDLAPPIYLLMKPSYDGVLAVPPAGMTAAEMAAGMTAACSTILGYEQPVEVKDA